MAFSPGRRERRPQEAQPLAQDHTLSPQACLRTRPSLTLSDLPSCLHPHDSWRHVWINPREAVLPLRNRTWQRRPEYSAKWRRCQGAYTTPELVIVLQVGNRHGEELQAPSDKGQRAVDWASLLPQHCGSLLVPLRCGFARTWEWRELL